MKLETISKFKMHAKITGVLLSTGVAMFVFGHGCTGPHGPLGEASLDGQSTPVAESAPASDIVPIQDAKTVSLIYSNMIIDHFVGCMGTGKASDRTLAVYEAKKGAITEFGTANTVTAPMMMAVSSITGELCTDLLDQEAALTASARRIFTNVDFAARSLPSDAVAGDAIRRLARSCWARNETDIERQTIMTQINKAFPAGSTNLTGRNAMLFICTSMMTSLDALTL